MPKVEVRKAITVFVSNSAEGDAKINIPFQPDEMIVRSICYFSSDAGDVHVYQLSTDFTQDPIANYYKTVAFSPGTTFQIHKPLNGTFHYLVTTNGSKATTAVGELALTLEFIKYKK